MCAFMHLYVKIRTGNVIPCALWIQNMESDLSVSSVGTLNKGIKIQSLLYRLVSGLEIMKFFKQLHM